MTDVQRADLDAVDRGQKFNSERTKNGAEESKIKSSQPIYPLLPPQNLKSHISILKSNF